VSAPVTAEELAAAERCAVSLTSIARYHAENTYGASFEFHARAQTTVERAAELLSRLARDLTERTADRDALAAKVETMLRDEEDARALRLAEHAAREDVAGKLAELQAAVRAHEEAARASGHAVPQRDLDLWAAAKA